MLKLSHVFVNYIKAYYALYDINLEISQGDKLVILGDNGSGKTSLLEVLVGLKKPTQGQIFLNDNVINSVIKNPCTLFITESGVFLKHKTVLQNLKWASRVNKLNTNIPKILQDYGLSDIKDCKVNKISEYQKFLLSFARGMMKSPQFIVIDDVFIKFNTDEITKAIALLKDTINKQNLTAVIAVSQQTVSEQLNFKTVKLNLGSLT